MADEKIAIDDIVEAAARGALRALDARKAGEIAAGSTLELVNAGFIVDIVIRCGGIQPPSFSRQGLNPQPLPP
jgi:hypothetical protein